MPRWSRGRSTLWRGSGRTDDENLALYKVARNYYFGLVAGTLQLSLYVNQSAYDELGHSNRPLSVPHGNRQHDRQVRRR